MNDFERTLAFVDESGNPNLEISIQGVSPYYVVAAVIVKEADYDAAIALVKKVRLLEFQGSEIKSSNIGQNDERRLRILSLLSPAPWRYLVFVADKSEIYKGSGLQYKKTFIKYLNGKMYSKIFQSFRDVRLLADEHGRSEFMESVKRYVEERCIPELFGGPEFDFANSKSVELIQVADLIAGSVARLYQAPDSELAADLRVALRPMVSSFDSWPLSLKGPAENLLGPSDDRNDLFVRDYCRRLVELYMSKFSDEDTDDARLRCAALGILFDEIRYGDADRYVSRAEILERLAEMRIFDVSDHRFQTGVISHFRDNGVIIGSSKLGYKIPTRLSDIHDYVDHCQKVMSPMAKRLSDARSMLLTSSLGELDMLADVRFSFLKGLVEHLGPLSDHPASTS